ncbi:hypothetical protein DFS34DRAFT_253472 [Phlyctochytrium arcticum]|nr:hypothetical protein DFS34DRAFT_253472 [Phlyctochytrium arcticum]
MWFSAKTFTLLATVAAGAGQVAAQAWGGCSRCSDGLNGGAILSFAGQNNPVAGNSLVAGGGRNAIRTGKMQVMAIKNGNLALLDYDGKAVWETKTSRPDGAHYLIMQPDGNLVYYDKDKKPIWASSHANKGTGPYCAILQFDRNFVVYDKSCTARWASNTSIKDRPAEANGNCKAHTIKAGDGCIKIAGDYGITQALLEKYNPGMKCGAIQPDQRLCVTQGKMPPPPTRPAKADGTCEPYDVVSGDTCVTMPAKCKTTQEAFDFLNPTCKKSPLKINQRFCCTSGKKVSRAPKQNGDNCFAYTVKDQETCGAIAAKFDLEEKDIENFNKQTYQWIGCSKIQKEANICLSTGNPPKPKIIKGLQCGPQSEGNLECPLKACCSAHGYCGTTKDFCEPTAQGFKCNSNCFMPTVPKTDGSAYKRKVAYYHSGGDTRACDRVQPEDLDLLGYTHLIFAFATLADSGGAVSFTLEDYEIARRLVNLKGKWPGLKVLYAIGGWDFSESDATKAIFSKAFETPKIRDYLITSITRSLTSLDWDGVDIDFEYPAAIERAGPQADIKNFGIFLRELKGRMPRDKLLTVAVPAGYWFLKGFDMQAVKETCDFINLMTYDFNGAWNAGPAGSWDKTAYYKTQPHTGIDKIKESTELIIRVGIPLSQINVGLAFYGRTYRLTNPGCTGYGCDMTAGGTAGECSRQVGVMSNMEIQRALAAGAVGVLDAATQTKYFNLNGNHITYDDKTTLDAKRAFAKSAGYGGDMAWAIDLERQPTANDPDSPFNTDENDIDSIEVLEEIWDEEMQTLVAENEGLTSADLVSIKPFIDNNAEKLKKKFNPGNFIGDTEFWKKQEGENLPDAIDKIMDATVDETDGAEDYWPHQRMQFGWTYMEALWDGMAKTWRETPDKEAYEGEVRKLLYNDKQGELLEWLEKNNERWFTCAVEWELSPSGKPTQICFNRDGLFGRPSSVRTPKKITWKFKDGQEDAFWQALSDDLGLDQDVIWFGGSGRYPVPKDITQVARIGINMPEVDTNKYPVKFLPLIEEFLNKGKPDYAAKTTEISKVEKLPWLTDDTSALNKNLDSFTINLSTWYNVYTSWWVSKNLDAKIEAQLEEQKKQARIQLILSLVFLVVGELIAPILAGAMAVAGRIASAAMRGIGKNKNFAKLIDEAASGSSAARARLISDKAWKESSAVKTFNKIKDKFKGYNDEMVCLVGEVAWEVGSGYIPTGAARRSDMSPRNARDAAYRLGLTLPSPFNASKPAITQDLATRDAYDLVNLFERAPSPPPAMSRILGFTDPTKATADFVSAGNRDGVSFQTVCERAFKADTKLKPYIADPTLDTANTSQDYAYWNKNAKGVLNADHMVEKSGVVTRFIVPLAELASSSGFSADIEKELSSYDGKDENGKDVKKNFALEMGEAVHGAKNMHFLDGCSNGGKEMLVAAGDGTGTRKVSTTAGNKYGHSTAANTMKKYIDDLGPRFEANAKHINMLQDEIIAHMKKKMPKLVATPEFKAYEATINTNKAFLLNQYKVGGYLSQNAATFARNMANNKPTALAKLFMSEGLNSESRAINAAKDADANKVPGTTQAEVDERIARRAAKVAANKAAKAKAKANVLGPQNPSKVTKKKKAACKK